MGILNIGETSDVSGYLPAHIDDSGEVVYYIGYLLHCKIVTWYVRITCRKYRKNK